MSEEIYGPGDPTHQLIRKLKKQERDWSLK